MKRVIRADNYLKSGKGFSYLLKHGLGPGTLPKDVEIIDYTEDGYKDIVWLNRRLNADELEYYDIKPYGVAINVMEAADIKNTDDFDERYDEVFGEPSTEVFTPEDFLNYIQEVIDFE